MHLGLLERGCVLGKGSGSVTSSPAAIGQPAFNATSRASGSTMTPRAVLMRMEPSFILAKVDLLKAGRNRHIVSSCLIPNLDISICSLHSCFAVFKRERRWRMLHQYIINYIFSVLPFSIDKYKGEGRMNLTEKVIERVLVIH